MKTIPTSNLKTVLMKRAGLIALVLAAPLGAMAQYVVFNDNFNNGSTTNHTSIPGGTPFASFTSYDIASTKTVVKGTPIGAGQFVISFDAATGSGFVEAEARFASTPVTLVNQGDYINLTYTFVDTNLLFNSTEYIFHGLFGSGGTVPPIGLNIGTAPNVLNGTGSSPYATGNCQNWQGYVSRLANGGTYATYTRPVQNAGGTTSANQDLLGNKVNTGCYANPQGVTFGSAGTASLPLTQSATYTVSYTIVLTDTNTPGITITDSVFSGSSATGTPVFTQTETATGTNVLTLSFDGLALGLRDTTSSANTIMTLSDITVSESIAGMPGQPFDVTGGGTACIGSAFPVGLDGSVTTNDYYVYTNGVWNGIVQTGTGSALSFGNESVISVPLTNTIVASNTVTGATGLMFGSAVVAPFAIPVITNEPIPVIVANGSIGVFSVGASGGGLTYQWYKNGSALSDGGNISGSHTSTLVISPASGGDAAPYYCTIIDGCNVSTNSTTNSLTIGSPANLVWQGNDPNTNWDLSITPNFNTGSAVFHNGDNVTFDDTASAYALSIANNYIAPTLITESSGNAYIFNGPGVIQGPGRLVMNGPGTLAINNSNALTGGVTINGGTLILSNLYGAGPGTLTLSSGGSAAILDIPFKAGSAVGISNNINVTTGNCTLQFDQNGTYGCVLDGALTGNSSATLTVNATYAVIPSTSRVRLYGQFTNNANIVLNSYGTEIEFAPYLGVGNEVFNGIISGNYGHIVPRGNGNIILNNTNTFNDSGLAPNATGYSLFMSSGNVGIGADSVSSVPPTIDASPVGTGMVAINVGNEGGNCSFFANGGPHTIANQFQYTSTTNTVTVTFSGSNDLTLSGEFDLALVGDPAGTNRTIDVTSTAATTLAGTISDNSINNGGVTPSGIIKTGGGSLYLNGTNTYAGPTTNTAGLLAGSGSIAGPVDIEINGSLGGGSSSSIGTLTINNNLTLNGNVFVRLDKDLSPAQSNDMVSVTGSMSSTGAGIVTVTNIGTTALAVGDTFHIFNGPVTGANTLSVTGGGMVWTNKLSVDGSIAALSVASTVATNPTNITFSVSGTSLSLSWPGDHLGWTLLTNAVGLASSNNWFPYPGSASVTNESLIIDRTQSNVFYRLVYPYP